jgi:hypothetical protein
MPRSTKAEQVRQAVEKLAELAWQAGFDHFREDPEAVGSPLVRSRTNLDQTD